MTFAGTTESLAKMPYTTMVLRRHHLRLLIVAHYCICVMNTLWSLFKGKHDYSHLAVWAQNNVQAAQKYLPTLLLPQNGTEGSGQVC